MSISDKTRKILWGRSGNRCAACRRELVISATDASDEAVVGEECHIVSAQGQGPRHDRKADAERLDEPENLILLCRVHHKMVDDQFETYTVEVLQKLKLNHEKWVSATLSDVEKQPKPLKIRVPRENTLQHLVRMYSGAEIMSVAANSYQYAFEHDDLRTEQEVELVGSFLQEVRDWRELWDDIEPAERVSTTFRLSGLVSKLAEAGFWVFGGREVRRLEGGVAVSPSPWPVCFLRVARADSDQIVKVTVDSSDQNGAASQQ